MNRKLKIFILLVLIVFATILYILSQFVSINFIKTHFSSDQVLVPEIKNFILGLSCFLKAGVLISLLTILFILFKKIRKFWLQLLLILSSFVFTFYIFLFWNHTIDDMYITLRYAENFVKTGQFVWNIGGEHIEGFSNFLWVLISSIFILFKIPEAIGIKILGIIFGIIFLFSIKTLGYRFEKENKKLPIFLFSIIALTPFYPFWINSGLETGLYLALFSWSLIFILQIDIENKVPWQLPIVLSLLSITRPEGAGLIFLSFLFFRKKTKKKYLLIIPLLFWIMYFIWRWNYFGSIFPVTVICKSKIGGGIIYLGSYYKYLLPFIPFFIIGISDKFSRKNFLFILILFSYTFFIINSTVAQGGYFRFLLPSLLIFYIFAAKGLTKSFEYISVQGVWKKIIAYVILTILILSITASQICSMKYSLDRYYKGHLKGHLALAVWLKETYPQNTSIAIVDCGLIPYYTKFTTYDMFGLNDIEIAKNGPQADYLLSLDPDLFILASLDSSKFIPRFPADFVIFPNEIFKRKYKKKIVFNRVFYYLWVFEKKQL